MTTEERIFYESVVGRIELREAIVHRDGIALERARWLRNAVGILAIIFVALRLAEILAPASWLEWLGKHDTAIATALVAGSLFAWANIWFAKLRLNDSRANLLTYVSRLPVPNQNITQLSQYRYTRERGAAVA